MRTLAIALSLAFLAHFASGQSFCLGSKARRAYSGQTLAIACDTVYVLNKRAYAGLQLRLGLLVESRRLFAARLGAMEKAYDSLGASHGLLLQRSRDFQKGVSSRAANVGDGLAKSPKPQNNAKFTWGCVGFALGAVIASMLD